MYAPGGHVKYAAISVRFPNVAGLPAAILFDDDGTVLFGQGMERDTGEVLMLPVFTAFDQWTRELHEAMVRRALGAPDGAALRRAEGKGGRDA